MDVRVETRTDIPESSLRGAGVPAEEPVVGQLQVAVAALHVLADLLRRVGVVHPGGGALGDLRLDDRRRLGIGLGHDGLDRDGERRAGHGDEGRLAGAAGERSERDDGDGKGADVHGSASMAVEGEFSAVVQTWTFIMNKTI